MAQPAARHAAFTLRPVPHALRVLCLGALVGMGAATVATPALAQATARAQERVQLDIPAGPLDGALNRLGRDAGVLITYGSALTDGLRSAELKGSFTVEEALARVLHGTGLAATAASGGGFAIRKAAPAMVPAVAAAPTASAAAAVRPAEDKVQEVRITGRNGRNYVARKSGSATQLDLSLLETPQSITVFTRQRLEDQGLTQLEDVAAQSVGLLVNQTGNSGSDSTTIYSRGFAVDNYLIDGVLQVDSNYSSQAQTDDVSIYERVEIVRGATGLMSGVGAPGGAMNLVRKRPTREFRGTAKIELGSWDYRRAEADLSTPINAAGTVRGRVVAAYQDNDASVDRLHERKKVLYGIVEADVAQNTLATVGFSVQHHDATGHARSGLPLYNADGTLAHWSRSASSAASWGYSERHVRSAFASLEHTFANEWKVKGQLSQTVHDYDEVIGYAAGGFADATTGAGINLWATHWQGAPKQNSFDLTASGPFELLGRRHQAAVGLSHARTRADYPGYTNWWHDGWDGSIDNIHTWNGSTPAAPANPAISRIDSEETTTSAFATVQFKPTDALSIIAGARTTRWRYDQRTRTLADGSVAEDNRGEDKVTPFLGAVYSITPDWTAYASYTTNFKPQSYAKDVNDRYLDPQTGKGFEVGTKYSLFDDRLMLSAAIYKNKQDNEPSYVASIDRYVALQGVRSKGFELEAVGEVLPNWQLSAGFSRNLSRDGEDNPVRTEVPQNSLKLFSTYKLPTVGNGLTVGGGLRWQNRIYKDGLGPNYDQRFVQGSLAVVDVMARYAITRNLEATLRVNNLFDRRYYTSATSAYYGTPRNVRVGLSATF